jgi:lysophospholipase L1-like esterase
MVAALGQMSDHPLYADIAAELNVPLQREGWSKVLGDSKLRSDAVHANAQGYVQFAHSLHSTAVAAGLLRQ